MFGGDRHLGVEVYSYMHWEMKGMVNELRFSV